MNSTLLQNPSDFDIRASDFLRVHPCGVADSPRMDTNSTNHNHRWTSRSPRFKDIQSNSKVFKDKFEHTTTITRPTSLSLRDHVPRSGLKPLGIHLVADLGSHWAGVRGNATSCNPYRHIRKNL